MKINKDSMSPKYANLSEKEDFHQSGITTFRRRTPTNLQTASKVACMIFDHSQQMAIWPDKKKDALVEHTQGTKQADYRTINRSGKPFALGVNIGGSPDILMNVFSKNQKAKILK